MKSSPYVYKNDDKILENVQGSISEREMDAKWVLINAVVFLEEITLTNISFNDILYQ